MYLRGLLGNFSALPRTLRGSRGFSSMSIALEKALPPRPIIPETEIVESFLKGTGPGGQKINKTSSAVQLKHIPTGIVVKCQETRSRPQNRKIARQLLADRLDELVKGPESRTAIKTERARVKKASATKKARRKYRKLEEQKAANMKDSGVDEALMTEGHSEIIPNAQEQSQHSPNEEKSENSLPEKR